MPIVLEPAAAAVIEAFRAANRPKYETMSAPEAREASKLGRAVILPDPPDVDSIEDITVARVRHGKIPLRVYKPATAPKNGPRPRSSSTTAAAG